MNDKGKIIAGLIIFLLIVTIPFSYSRISKTNKGRAPEVEILPSAGEKCVESKEYMRSNHMDLLNQWRDQVVRQNDRFTTGPKGGRIEKSLTNSCLDCHSNKENFCDRCHNYMAVSPYCFNCHLEPKEITPEQMTQVSTIAKE